MELDDREIQSVLKRLPEFKLSYETVSHKKVSHYDTALAIPYGKKCYVGSHMRMKTMCVIV